MSREIRVQYEEVYSKTAELQRCIQVELQEMEASYHQATSSVHRMDSRTNAAFMEIMAANRLKAQVTAETLNKLLSFIETSARQIERDEAMIKRAFALSRINAIREGGRV